MGNHCKKADGKKIRYEKRYSKNKKKNLNPTYRLFSSIIAGSNSKAISFPIQCNQEGILFHLEFPFLVHSFPPSFVPVVLIFVLAQRFEKVYPFELRYGFDY